MIQQIAFGKAMLKMSRALFVRTPKSSLRFSLAMPGRNTLGKMLERMIFLIDEERTRDAEALENEFLELTEYE